MNDSAVRFAEGSQNTIEGLLVPFDGPFPGGKDSYATRFGPNTEYALDWFNSRPLLYSHALRGGPGLKPVGKISDLAIRDDVGVWMKAELDAQNEYFQFLREQIEEEKLFLSSGSIGHLVKIDDASGDVLQWPIAEGSLTMTPANTYASIPVHSFASSFRSAGIDLDDAARDKVGDDEAPIVGPEFVRASMTAKERDALPDSAFAYIDSDGKRHLPVNDAAHTRAAMARFNQTEFESDAKKAAAKKKILAAAKKFDIDVSDFARMAQEVRAGAGSKPVANQERSFEDIRDDISEMLNDASYGCCPYYSVVATYPGYVIYCVWDDGDQDYYKVEYTLDDNDEPVLGKTTSMEMVYVPTGRSGTGPLSLDARALVRTAESLTQRTQDLSERRLAEKRTLSLANRHQVAQAADALEATMAAMRTFLDADQERATAAAKAAYAADPDVRRRRIRMLELAASL